MMHGGGNTPFTVIYSDGDKEINLGSIVVDPSMNFKHFITLLSHMVGIPPYQLSVFLITAGTDRKIPITAKVNLASIAGYGSMCYFFVKSSRQFRKSPTNNKNPPQNVVLLHREAAASAFASGGGAVCEVCLVGKLTGNDSDFHLCVHDNVIKGFFRSTAGPISRPARNSDEYYCPLFGGRWFSFMEA
ncbi:hypothetical protein SESBI_23903 [Sesbania bispinosa]|nr:hypothetical protein SESBI_23903 [Sesbania bispinosa]